MHEVDASGVILVTFLFVLRKRLMSLIELKNFRKLEAVQSRSHQRVTTSDKTLMTFENERGSRGWGARENKKRL